MHFNSCSLLNYNLEDSLAVQKQILAEYAKSQQEVQQDLETMERYFERQVESIQNQQALVLGVKVLPDVVRCASHSQ